jgi:hypothetical protein
MPSSTTCSLPKIKLIFWCITGTEANLKGNNDHSATRHIPFGAGVIKLHCCFFLALLRGDYETIFSGIHIDGSRVTRIYSQSWNFAEL